MQREEERVREETARCMQGTCTARGGGGLLKYIYADLDFLLLRVRPRQKNTETQRANEESRSFLSRKTR